MVLPVWSAGRAVTRLKIGVLLNDTASVTCVALPNGVNPPASSVQVSAVLLVAWEGPGGPGVSGAPCHRGVAVGGRSQIASISVPRLPNSTTVCVVLCAPLGCA